MNVCLDAHHQDQLKGNIILPQPAPPQAPSSPSAFKRLMHRFCSGPKKTSKAHSQSLARALPPAPPKLSESLTRYFKLDRVLARAYVSWFGDIARWCDTSLFKSSFPLIGQKSDSSSEPSWKSHIATRPTISRPHVKACLCTLPDQECYNLREVHWHARRRHRCQNPDYPPIMMKGKVFNGTAELHSLLLFTYSQVNTHKSLIWARCFIVNHQNV